MKKVFAIACLLIVLTFALVTMASAAVQPDWRFNIKADNGANMYSTGFTTIGVTATAVDGSDTVDVKLLSTNPPTSKAVAGVINSLVWSRDFLSNALPSAYPNGEKIWDLRVVGLGTADTNTPIRLAFTTVTAAFIPVSTLGGVPVNYWLRMVDNQDVVGAYANGTVWSIPIPTVHSTTVPYFTLTLPTINVDSFTPTNVINQGYAMQFYQTAAPVVTPEPSSFLALGAGLMGLAGLVSRRRRS